jgi:hypothetical protein
VELWIISLKIKEQKQKNGFLGGCSGGGQTTPNLSAWGGLATPTHLFWVVQIITPKNDPKDFYFFSLCSHELGHLFRLTKNGIAPFGIPQSNHIDEMRLMSFYCIFFVYVFCKFTIEFVWNPHVVS